MNIFRRSGNLIRVCTNFSTFIYKNTDVCPPVHRLFLYNNSFKTNAKNKSIYLLKNVQRREFHGDKRSPEHAQRHRSTVYYVSAIIVLTVGLSYAAVPLYRIFCQAYSYGGITGEVSQGTDLSTVKKQKDKEITIKFNADVSSSLNWNFQPQQTEIKVIPGETALAFYTAENPLDKPVIGVSTYNVVPFDAGQYFNKIQCFCFEEQMLNPHEQVDMPVFFYIDPEFSEDPKMEFVDSIVLSYTFFEVKDGMNLPIPSYYNPHNR